MAIEDLSGALATGPNDPDDGSVIRARRVEVFRWSVALGQRVTLLHGVEWRVDPGEHWAVMGPNGAGKTTLLNTVAGLLRPADGTVRFNGADITGAEPADLVRAGLALVPEHRRIFKDLTVEENLRLGGSTLRLHQRVSRVYEMADLFPVLRAKWSTSAGFLSGGEAQQLAVARALMCDPKLLLLDEPLGALDRKLREHTQFELVNIQERVGTTFVMVTHDQEEAMTMASRLAVMNFGRIEQVSTPAGMYEYPASRFVAEFIGATNIFEGRIASQDEGEGTVRVYCDALGSEILARHADPIPVGTPVAVSVRPEKIDVHETRPEADNVAMGRVAEIAYLGDVSIYQVKTPAGAVIRVQETHIVRSSEPHYDWDDTLYLSWEAGSAVVLPT
ncbi:MAG: ABC transporter ATP-binding protein [Xanthomonadaceae bacterium]|nr:ABC transporter ATP-binding protein [Xanthomonadaceae bacterium]